jgi:hypothetical protein
MKILKRGLKHIIKKMTDWKDFVFANSHKKAYAHCTHLQIAQSALQMKFAKECNLANLHFKISYLNLKTK